MWQGSAHTALDTHLTHPFSHTDFILPFRYCSPTTSTTSTLRDFATQPASAPPGHEHEHDQTQALADLARMHNFTPRPELRPFPISHPYLYYLFPPPPTAALITQAVVHPSLVSDIPISKVGNPEITGTRGRRTAMSERDGMKAGEVKGPMYENVPLIDVRTGVVHYPGAGHTCVMTGGVRIGSCAEEEREVMELLELTEENMEGVETEGVRSPATPTPERPMSYLPSTPTWPSTVCLVDQHQHQHHAQSGYAYASPPSSPVHVRRPSLALFEYPHAAQQQQQTAGMVQPTPRHVYGYQTPGFASPFSPAVYCVPTPPPPPSPAPILTPYMGPAPLSYVSAGPRTPQSSPGSYAWYGVSAGNAYTPVADACAHTPCPSAHGYPRPLSAAPPANDRHPILPTPLPPPPARPRRGTRRAVGKQPTLGLDGNISLNGTFRVPDEEANAAQSQLYLYPDPHPDPIERPASVPPEGERENRKRKRDEYVWDYRDGMGLDGGDEVKGRGGDEGEGVSDDEVFLGAEERKRARISGCGNAGARRRSFGDDKERPGSAVRHVFSFVMR